MHLSGSGKDSPCVPVKDRPASLHELGTTGTALSRSSSSSSGSRVHTYDNSHPSGHHLLSSSRSVDTSTARSAPPEPGEAVQIPFYPFFFAVVAVVVVIDVVLAVDS